LFFGSVAVFWAAGLAICLFVGPVQSASRNLLTRLSRPRRETEPIGLSAPTRRALRVLGTGAVGPAGWSASATRAGILPNGRVAGRGLLGHRWLRAGGVDRLGHAGRDPGHRAGDGAGPAGLPAHQARCGRTRGERLTLRPCATGRGAAQARSAGSTRKPSRSTT